jgi:hypothetical protein
MLSCAKDQSYIYNISSRLIRIKLIMSSIILGRSYDTMNHAYESGFILRHEEGHTQKIQWLRSTRRFFNELGLLSILTAATTSFW